MMEHRTTFLPDRTGATARYGLPLPPRRPVGRPPVQIVSCMAAALAPTRRQVDELAGRIWSEVQTGSRLIPWPQVAPGSRVHRRMIAAALVALGGAAAHRRAVGP